MMVPANTHFSSGGTYPDTPPIVELPLSQTPLSTTKKNWVIPPVTVASRSAIPHKECKNNDSVQPAEYYFGIQTTPINGESVTLTNQHHPFKAGVRIATSVCVSDAMYSSS